MTHHTITCIDSTTASSNNPRCCTQVLLPHRRDVKLLGVSVSARHLVTLERRDALPRATVYELPADGSAPAELGEGRVIDFEEPAYTLEAGGSQSRVVCLSALLFLRFRAPELQDQSTLLSACMQRWKQVSHQLHQCPFSAVTTIHHVSFLSFV